MTSELERLKILEGKISQVVEHINKLVSENDRLKQQLKELKVDRKTFEEQAKKTEAMDQNLQMHLKQKTTPPHKLMC